MMMKKLMMIMSASLPLFMWATLSQAVSKSMTLKMPTMTIEQLELPVMALSWETKSKIFIMMVMVVTTVVVSYSEIYMEHYNNKKFLNMLSSFLVAMLILSSSESMLNMMTGWELLGLSSLMLIMFYPNKTGKMNSILTMFFNRLGDIALIVVLGSVMAYNSGNVMSSIVLEESLLSLIVVCALTKSAQFPMSAWLPAAMAAPTPISAMVHSSTLVTAGVFLVMKYHENITPMGVAKAVCLLSMVSFVLGGLMGMMEMDYKKMIAFSTMSQISMVMHFTGMVALTVALTHMVYHALFKTLLFCMAGMIFIGMWGSQNSTMSKVKAGKILMTSMMVTSIFSMTGLLFSASFFTKDLFLENMIMEDKTTLKAIFLIVASVMTMAYSVKMMRPLKKMESPYGMTEKKAMSLGLALMALACQWVAAVNKSSMFNEMFPLIMVWEVIGMIFILMIAPILMVAKGIKSKGILSMTNEVAHMKFMMFAVASKTSEELTKVFENDLMTMKKSLSIMSVDNVKTSGIYPVILAMYIVKSYKYSNSLGNMALKMLKKKNS